jgi:hypothetical protein
MRERGLHVRISPFIKHVNLIQKMVKMIEQWVGQ